MATLAMVGVFWGGFAGLVPDIKAIAGASDGQFGLAMMMSAVGSMIAMFFAPRYFAKLARYALPLAGAALLVAFHYPIFATNLTLLAIALTFMGATVGLLDISSNMRVSMIEARYDASLMNVNHAMFSFAFGGAAILVAFARQQGMVPGQILPGLALIAAILLIFSFERSADWVETADEAGDGQTGGGQMGKVVILNGFGAVLRFYR